MAEDRVALQYALLSFFQAKNEALIPIVEICKQLGQPKKLINSVLYELLKNGIVDKVVESPPVWRLCSKTDETQCYSELPRVGIGSDICLAKQLPSSGTGRGLTQKEKNDQDYAVKRIGLGRGSQRVYSGGYTVGQITSNECMPNRTTCETLGNRNMVVSSEEPHVPKQDSTLSEQATQPPKLQELPETLHTASAVALPLDIMMKLAEDVLSRLRNTDESLTSAQLALELGFDEGSINSVLYMLSSHKKIVYRNLSNTWGSASLNNGLDMEELSDIERQVLNQVSLAEDTVTTMQIARALGYKRKKELNPILYGLKKQGYIMKVQESPPCWKSLTSSNNLAKDIEMTDNSLNMLNISRNTSAYKTVMQNQTENENIIPFGSIQAQTIPKTDNLDTIPNIAAQSVKCFATLQKNPLSALYEFGQKNKVESKVDIAEQCGSPHTLQFRAVALVNGEILGEAWASTKKDSKRIAAEIAVRTLVNRDMKVQKPNVVDSLVEMNPRTPFCDVLAGLSHKTFNSLLFQIPDYISGRKVLATILLQSNENDYGSVVALGTGNRCIMGEKLSLEGLVINDSHAEVVARRGLVRFLYKQLLKFDPDKVHPLFEKCNETSKLRLKDNIKFHLYISTAPCGDAALFSRNIQPADLVSTEEVEGPASCNHRPLFTNSPLQGLLRAKIEAGEGTIPLLNNAQLLQPFDAVVHGERLCTMSCSDKLLRWNVLGLQGALLSNFLEPIYLSSLTLGQLYHQGHLSRAVCCRLQREGKPDFNSQLGKGFFLNHPNLGQVTVVKPARETERTKPFSINWVHGDDEPEIIDGVTGICKERSEECSRLSKSQLFCQFKAACQLFSATDLTNKTYGSTKKEAKEFQKSKHALLTRIQELGYGRWLQKPIDEEMFL